MTLYLTKQEQETSDIHTHKDFFKDLHENIIV